MSKTYKARIMGWNWAAIVDDTKRGAENHGLDIRDGNSPECGEGCDLDGHAASTYLGSVMSLAPSGKFYTPWTTNQTADDVERDGRWYAALEAVATKMGGWIENGDGDPTDLYFLRYWTMAELNPDEWGACDECDRAYLLASRDGRCGDCGMCPLHCTHA